jgi:hypothetical protein
LAVKALTVASGVKTMTDALIFIWLKKIENPFGRATALWAVGVDLFFDSWHPHGSRHVFAADRLR